MNYLDLFAGAGGLSEGFRQTGFNPVAHVESNKDACQTIKTRIAYYYLKDQDKENLYYDYLQKKIDRDVFYNLIPYRKLEEVISLSIGDENNDEIFRKIDSFTCGSSIDLIIGGPPCQTYSLAGRGRDKNRIDNDPRNYLYKHYALFLKKYTPKLFVFENVLGLRSAKDGSFLKDIEKSFDEAGYKFELKELNAADFGVIQDRKRLIFIGWQKGTTFKYPDFPKEFNMLSSSLILDDLPKLKHGEEKNVCSYENEFPNQYLIDSGIRNGVNFVTQHIARPHNQRDLEIYKIAVEKWDRKKERLKYFELPERLKTHKNENSFVDRFKVVNAHGLCHTVIAHIGKDGHYYIHPDLSQNRSLSIREAARVQSFPDNYFFEGSRTSIFRQIGNAVPPLMAYKIAQKIKEMLC